ncbi:MAG: hypothetical protein ACR652_09750 [Methylocystis sp.]|uniref:hypothetical protein n=1 Tax=Methylocystis sp. TaxID=1911079 RepID=UPI003DA56D60
MCDAIFALAAHEAGHAAAIHVLALKSADVVVQARLGQTAATLAGYVGVYQAGRRPSVEDIPLENPGPPPSWVQSFESWRLFLPGALVSLAGPLAQERVAGNRHGDEGDMRQVANLASLTRYASGRDPEAWARMARMITRRMLASPMVWGGVESLADALARGLRMQLHMAGRDGDEGLVEFVVPAAEAERLLEQGGARRGIFEHLGAL